MKQPFFDRLKQYMSLVREERTARQEMLHAEKRITYKQKKINLNTPKDENRLCINRYSKVVFGNSCEDTPFISYCDHFKHSEACTDCACRHSEANKKYIAAWDNFIKARAACKKFLKEELFCRNK